jgi:diguanylate cyclase (GGDEF)-like protein/PAS domain S-box-containing protein
MNIASVNTSNPLILVVDDSAIMRQMLRQVLEGDGYSVVEAEDGERALDLFERLHPNIILMDCLMPRMDGITACARLQELPGGNNTPVIMITSFGDDKFVDLAFEAGASDYLTKPVHWPAFRQRVRRMLYTKTTEASLKQSEAFAQSIINHALDGVITIDYEGIIRSFNPASEQIFGYKSGEIVARDISQIIPEFFGTLNNSSFSIEPYCEERICTNTSHEVRGQRKDGSGLPIELSLSKFPAGERWMVTIILRDITQRKQVEEELRESEERYRALTENAYDLISEIGVRGEFLYISPNYNEVLGYTAEELIGKRLIDFIHPDDRQGVKIGFQRVFESAALEQMIYRFINKNGEFSCFESTGKVYQTASGDARAVFISRDTTERLRYEDTIWHQAFHDILTDLPNRLLFRDRLNLAMAHAKRNEHMLAVLFLDLDRFKLINDTLGHGVGDLLLREVTYRLTQSVRDEDTVARMGGDEFAILLPKVLRIDNAAKVATKILESIKQPLNVDGHELYITTSIGIVIYPNDGEDAGILLKNADTAMYLAKEKGRNNYQLYAPAMNDKAIMRLALENNLRRALLRDEFVVYYQPKFNTVTSQIIGMEALVRWQHPDLGLVPPSEFIPIAEETGLIVPLGEWVLRNVCIQNKAWQDAGLFPLRVAVNLSARQFQLQYLVEMVSRVLKETEMDPKWLELEITESVAMQNAEFAVIMLNELKEMGIQLTIDDFGTGYSSLSYLKRFPIDKLKIDRSFISEICEDHEQAAIASTVIVLGQSLKLGVIAEGVETLEQFNFLKQRQCDEMQGFLLGKPMPAIDFGALLMKKKEY